MKGNFIRVLAISAILLGCGKYDDSTIRSDISDLNSRVSALEQQCRNMNENLSSLQAIVVAVQKQDCIVSVTELPDNAGYAVLFTSGKTIYLYNGVNGENGKNGTDGMDGHTPKISVRLDSDGVYYWTLDGEWLIVDGKKVKAVGTDGSEGAGGKDGADGITPKLKIEDGFWYITYDNGVTWSKLGKATGDDGKDGKNGLDGSSFFKSVTIEDGYAIFVLNDKEQTMFKVPMAGTVSANTVTGIKYVPEYSDGIIRCPYNTKATDIIPGSFTVRFEILPSSAAAYMADNWKSMLSAKAIYTRPATKSSVGDFVAMPITDVKVANGIASIVVSAGELEENFFRSDSRSSLSASIFLKIKDGDNEISSDYIPLVPVFNEAEKIDIPGSVANIVDMGLSVDWASWNVGAESEFDRGGNYGWGDPTGEKISWDNLDDYPSPFPPECISGGEYDIATQMWGEGWRIPTKEEWTELDVNCVQTVGSSYGVKYMKFVSKINGNHIYLPYSENVKIDNEEKGCYWTGDLYEKDNTSAWFFVFPMSLKYQHWERTHHYKIRPVHNKVIPTTKDASNITFESATLNGSVYGVKEEVEVGFYYGTSKPENVKDFENKVSTKSNSIFSVDIDGLVDKTTYYYAAYVKDGENELYGEISSFVAENTVYEIGDYYPNYKNIEGIVFYVDYTKKHGKIVSLENSSSKLSWLWGIQDYGYTCTRSDDGSKNTLPNGPLKKWIKEKGEGWYCPALNELLKINSSLGIINSKLANIGCNSIEDSFYWSSTQYSPDYSRAYIVCVTESYFMGYQSGYYTYPSISNEWKALAVKKF